MNISCNITKTIATLSKLSPLAGAVSDIVGLIRLLSDFISIHIISIQPIWPLSDRPAAFNSQNTNRTDRHTDKRFDRAH